MQITPYSKNAKRHPKKHIEQVANSIKEFGMNQPIVVDKEGVIIVGHGRYEALKHLGWSEEEIAKHVKVADLTEEQAKAYRLADNKLNESEWDMGLAIEELKGLSDEMFDLTGFDKDLLIEPDEKDDVIPENVPPTSKLGDVWQLGRHRVMCGDSTDKEVVARLMEGNKADMVFTDPPYGVSYDGGHANEKRRDKLIGDESVSLYEPACRMAFEFSEGNAPLYLWHAGVKGISAAAAAALAGYEIRAEIIWNKNQAQYGAISAQYKQKHEPCFYCYKKGSSARWGGSTTEVTVWDINRASKNEYHPTQKPVELATRAIKNHDVASVLDLFLGSGSTLIACEKTNRICYGMELDPKYVDVIIKRWEDYTGQKAVLTAK